MKHIYVLLGASIAASTCSVLAAQPAPVIEVNGNGQREVAPLSLSERVATLERKLDARNRAQVNMQRQLTELQNEVDELRGITELHSHKLGQILERQRELYQELDRRVNEAIKTPQVPVSIAAKKSNVSPVIDYSSNLTENEAYDLAVNLVLKDKKYEQAIEKFKSFNKKYPDSSYAANSHYWLGQLLFTKGELTNAEREFSIVVNEHKKSSKRSDALLKLAMVADKQNNLPKARNLYSLLIKEYPSTSAAQLATTRLDALAK